MGENLFITAHEIHFICGGKYSRYRRHKKRAKQFKMNQGVPSLQEPVFTQAREKRASVTHRIYYDRGEKFS